MARLIIDDDILICYHYFESLKVGDEMTKRKVSEYQAEYAEFKKLAKRADQRLIELVKVSKQPGFENILKWGYARAMRDIQQWTPGGRTFNVGVPKQATDDFGLKQLQAKKRDVIDFLNMVTSTKTKTLDMFERKAASLNKHPGVNLTWQDLGGVFENKEENSFYQKGGITYLQSVSYLKANDERILQQIENGERVTIRTGNRKANKMVKDILNEYGLDFADLYTKKKDQ